MVEKLEQENRALKDEVAALRSQLEAASSASGMQDVASPVPLATRQPLGEISANTPGRTAGLKVYPKQLNVENDVDAKYAELQEEYAKLATSCERLRRVKDATDAGARKQRQQKENWRQYAEKLEAKLGKLKAEDHERGVQLRSSTEPTRPHADSQGVRVDGERGDPRPVPSLKEVRGSSVCPQPSTSASFSGFEMAGLRELTPRRATSNPPDARQTEFVEPTAESTQDDDDDAPEDSLPQLPPNEDTPTDTTIKNEPSSDLPVVVFERRVGKRKHMDDLRDDMRSGTPRKFKTEEQGSDPLVTGESHHFSPQESLDLDIDGSMPTPRKMRILQMQERCEVISPDNHNTRGRSGIFDLWSLRAATSLTAVVEPPRNPAKELYDYARPRKTAAHSGLKLTHGIASLAEDGYEPTHSGQRAQTRDELADAPSRLSTLLNNSSPAVQAQAPILRPNRQSRETSRSNAWLTDTPARVLPFGKCDAKDSDNTPTTSKSMIGDGLHWPTANTKAVSRVQTPRTTTPLTSKYKGTTKRLRDMPLASLKLDDFKINPKFNNGHNFAFTEVVRNKDERAEIPGCVDPQCCGKHFRAMAQSELEAAGPSLTHRAADIALLEDYLGDQVYKLGSMSRQEKEELWLEAKTRELANKHGKHRHRFTRRQSPPGFWNADFPSTQENQADRAEGERREKRMLEERYMEAMRDGGRWLFRDE